MHVRLVQFRLWIAALLLAAVWTGCGKRTTPVEVATERGLLLVGIGADPSDLDPHLTTGLNEYKVHQALFEGLVTPDPYTLEARPGVAERWEVSADGLTYTFHLRRDARWSNGEPLDASDFLFSWRRMLSPSLGADYAQLLYILRGAEAFNKGQTQWETVGVHAPDAYTLVAKLEHPAPYFLSLLYHNAFMPVPQETIAAHGELFKRGNKWTLPGNHISNGPFQLKDWNLTQHLQVEKNPHYWDAEAVALSGIRFYGISNQNTEERAFRVGQLHVTESVPFAKIAPYAAEQPHLLRKDPWLAVYYYLFNTTKPPLDDVRVRRALAMAVDRRAIVENITLGGQPPAHNFTPAMAGFSPKAKLAENTAEAQRLLAEAGYPGGEGFPKLEILYNTSEFHRPIAEAIQQMWRERLGVEITLRNTSWKAYLAERKEKSFDIARAGWIADFADPVTFLSILTSDSGNNHSGWGNAQFDALLNKAGHAADPAQRMALLEEADALITEAMPVMPLYFYTRIYLIHPDVQGWHANLLDVPVYKGVSLRKEGGD